MITQEGITGALALFFSTFCSTIHRKNIIRESRRRPRPYSKDYEEHSFISAPSTTHTTTTNYNSPNWVDWYGYSQEGVIVIPIPSPSGYRVKQNIFCTLVFMIYTSQAEVQKNNWNLQNKQLAVLWELMMTVYQFVQHFLQTSGAIGNSEEDEIRRLDWTSYCLWSHSSVLVTWSFVMWYLYNEISDYIFWLGWMKYSCVEQLKVSTSFKYYY